MRKREMMKHQRASAMFLRKHRGQAGLFLDLGTGKTLVAIRYGKRHLPTLIICRRDDFKTWRDELELEGVDFDKVFFLKKGRKFDYKQAICKIENCQIQWVIVAYDSVKNKLIYKFIRFVEWQLVVADESQMIKRWKARRTKKVIRGTRHIPCRIPMTGTLITNDVGDVFTQCLFADDGRTFGKSWWDFRERYYIKSGPGWYLKRGAKEKIIKKLQSVGYFVDQDDALRLPPVRHIVKSAPMSGQQRRYYKKILGDWEMELRGQTVEIDRVITQLIKLRQVASGFLYDQDHKAIWMKCYKFELLKTLLTSSDYLVKKPKIVIWCAHTAEIEAIAILAAKSSIDAVTYYGRNRKMKELARDMFKKNKRVRLFIAQVDSGVGMNELVVSDTAIYYSNSFRVVSRQQSKKRIRRKGSERHRIITYWDLVTEGSIDEHILKCLQSNIFLADYILAKVREGQRIFQILNK